MTELRSIMDIIDNLDEPEKIKLFDDYIAWYGAMTKLYKTEFGLDETPPDNGYVHELTEDQAIQFFRTALLWWYRKKPVIGEVLNLLDMLKTKKCLEEIQSLKCRLEKTGICISSLNINENLS